MIKNILYGSDGSAYSRTAGEYALDLAMRLDARLEAVYIVDLRLMDCRAWPSPTGFAGWADCSTDQFRQALQDRGTNILQECMAQAATKNIPLKTSLEFGNPAQTFADIQSRAELIVLGRQGEHAATSPGMTGSTMERFIRRAACPCLITPEHVSPIRRILVAVDGSPSGARALHEAIELANPLCLPLVILCVADSPSELDRAQQVAEEAHASARAHECAAASMVAIGPPAHKIMEEATAVKVDLIILGMHGHGRIYDRILGGTAAHIASRSPLPVLLVP